MLTQEILKTIINYDEKTGELFWKRRDVSLFKAIDNEKRRIAYCEKWNRRFANKLAFTTTMKSGYKQGAIFCKLYNAHRIIWLYMTGEWPDQVDHKNGIRDDNRWENLQNVTKRENGKNQKKRSHNTSGFTGVVYHKRDSNWKAQISINGKPKSIGTFATKEEARAAYIKVAIENGYSQRHINGE